MTNDSRHIGLSAMKPQAKELQEENKMLLDQLHVVQEELERLHSVATPQKGIQWVDDQLPDCLAENRYLHAVVETQKEIHRLETTNALAGQIGEILIRGTASTGALAGVPNKLWKVWRQANQQTPPDVLGGKGFDKVIGCYRDGGLAAVDALLTTASVSPTMQANALTALARTLTQSELDMATEVARRAYAIEPRPFRLKWLAFRMHESGALTEAEAMLDALPADMQFSDSEERQASRLRVEARQARLREAQQRCGYSKRRAEVEKQLNMLTRERDEQQQMAAGRGREVEALKQARGQLEQEKSALVGRYEEQEKLAAERQEQIDALKQAQAQLEQEKLALAGRQEEAAKLAAERGREVEALKQARGQLEQEKSALVGRYEEQEKLAAERQEQIDALKQAQAQLEQEKLALAGRRLDMEKQVAMLAKARDDQAKLALEKQGQITQLTQANSLLEQENDHLVKRLAELERDRLAQVAHYDEQAQLVQELQKQLDELRQQVQSRTTSETEFLAHQQLMHEELARAEAQIDLIKDVLLREPGL